MNPHTGEVRVLVDGELPPPGWVEVIGTADQVRTLSENVRAGSAERDRRKARRQAQRASRRRNR